MGGADTSLPDFMETLPSMPKRELVPVSELPEGVR
jgi:hypothetical protein